MCLVYEMQTGFGLLTSFTALVSDFFVEAVEKGLFKYFCRKESKNECLECVALNYLRLGKSL